MVTLGQTLSAQPATAAGTPVYNSVPAVYPNGFPSVGFQSYGTKEAGQLVHLAGTDRRLEDVTVSFSSWECETGEWNDNNCVTTTPGGGFTHPVTINVYAAAGDSTVDGNLTGALLGSVTQTITVPFRPSATPALCPADPTRWYDGTTCQSNRAFQAVFPMGSVAANLPDDIIVAVAYNTSTTGAAPIGTPGPYDNLNLSFGNVLPSIGTDPTLNDIYLDAFAGRYLDGGASGSDVLRVDANDWAGARLVLSVSASPIPPAAGVGGAIGAADPTLAATGSEPVDPTLGWVALGTLLAGAAAVALSARRRRATA